MPTETFSGSMRALRGKLPVGNMKFNEAFRYAIGDLKKNAEIYLADYLEH